MPDPVRAWAAVAPDGTPHARTARNGVDAVWGYLMKEMNRTQRSLWSAGWRVVPVKIEVMEGQKDG